MKKIYVLMLTFFALNSFALPIPEGRNFDDLKPLILSDLVIKDLSQKETLTVLVLGDTGTGEDDQYRVADSSYKVCQELNCDFAIITGDIIYDDGIESVYDPLLESNFEKAYYQFDINFWIVAGNHDHNGEIQPMIDYSLISQRWVMPDLYYAIPNLPSWVHFYGVDRAERKESAKAAEEYLCSVDGWKFLFDHHALYSNGRHGDDRKMQRSFEPIIEDCKVHAVLSGHDHHLEFIENSGDWPWDQIISGSAAKQRTCNSSRSRNHKQIFTHCAEEDRRGDIIEEGLGFLIMKISKSELTYEFYDGDGKSLWSITRNMR
jgi:predicted phosphodiesterase